MDKVFVVYKDSESGKFLQSVYSNELEALKEANYYNMNSVGANLMFYVASADVFDKFEI